MVSDKTPGNRVCDILFLVYWKFCIGPANSLVQVSKMR